jgi:hypothetical protein
MAFVGIDEELSQAIIAVQFRYRVQRVFVQPFVRPASVDLSSDPSSQRVLRIGDDVPVRQNGNPPTNVSRLKVEFSMLYR